MADERQAVAQGGSLPRFWAVERVRRVVRATMVSFMVVVVAGGDDWSTRAFVAVFFVYGERE